MKRKNGSEYAIDFNTREGPNQIEAVTVALNKRFMHKDETVRVDLCDHPLYPKLVKYVLNNPPREPVK